MNCPKCGGNRWQCLYCHYVGPLEYPLIAREELALAALARVIGRNGGIKPSTLAVACEMRYSPRWAYETLRALERKGRVSRPDGPRSGWTIVWPGKEL